MFTMAVATTDTIDFTEQGKVFHQYEASCEFIALTMAVNAVKKLNHIDYIDKDHYYNDFIDKA